MRMWRDGPTSLILSAVAFMLFESQGSVATAQHRRTPPPRTAPAVPPPEASIAPPQPVEPPPPAISESARARMAQGEALFDAENYTAALVEFEAAYEELEANPGRYILLFNIGQCYERTFRYDRALLFYRRFQSEGGPEAAGDTEVAATIRALEGLLSTLVISTNAPQATVWVDGLEVATVELQGDVRVAGGLHNVEVRAEGYTSVAREVQTPARQRVEVDFQLTLLSTYEGIDPIVFWLTGGAAVIAGAVGLGFGISTQLSYDQLDGLDGAGTRNPTDLRRLQDSALIADVFFGVAGALAIATVVVAFVTDWDGTPSANEQARLIPWATPSAGGASVIGVW